MANRRYTQFFYTPHTMPVLLDCNFIVDSTNGNGFGVRSLKGPGIKNIYMHTSSTPAAGNPNPASGIIVVRFQDSFNRYFGGFSGQVSALTTPVSTVAANTSYVITDLGTATLAQWLAVGVPAGIVPAVGLSFVAIASQSIGGSATAAPTATAGSNIDHIEVLGDPNVSLYCQDPGKGGQIILQCFKAQAVTAPADGASIGLSFYLSNSSVLVRGE